MDIAWCKHISEIQLKRAFFDHYNVDIQGKNGKHFQFDNHRALSQLGLSLRTSLYDLYLENSWMWRNPETNKHVNKWLTFVTLWS